MNKALTIFWIICVVLTTIFNVFICYCLNQINSKIDKIKLPEPEVITIEKNISPIPYKHAGQFTATFYTHTGNRTKTGVYPKAKRTVAVDPKIIPLGSVIYIKGYGVFIAEDIGEKVKGKRLDIFVNSKQEAINLGIKKVEVYKL